MLRITMKELVVKINLFTMDQTAIIIKDNVVQETFPFQLKSLTQLALSIEDLQKVTIKGNPAYIQHYADKLKEAELEKYGRNSLEIIVQGAGV